MLLVCHGHPTMVAHARPNLGRLIQPRHYSSIEATARAGIPWAADNDAFGGWDAERAERWEEMLERCARLPGCLFATAPDVVGDRDMTDMMYEQGASLIMRWGLPAAYVLQDGGEHDPPWGAMDALFIGGTDALKLGPFAAAMAREAKRRGKHVHMGRVNSATRIRYAKSIGCDSVDGQSWAKWKDRWLDVGLDLCAAGAQLRLDA